MYLETNQRIIMVLHTTILDSMIGRKTQTRLYVIRNKTENNNGITHESFGQYDRSQSTDQAVCI